MDGSLISNEDGLEVTTSGGGSRIAGLAINLFGTAGSFGAGISLIDSSDNLIEGNFIGTDASGTIALGNQTRGVFISSGNNNIIGGSSPASRNLISGNQERGIYLLGDVTGTLIQNNLIGTDLTGTQALGNDDGIHIQPSTTDTLVVGNLISGNVSAGIVITGFVPPAAADNQIQGNLVGTDVTGTQALGNGGPGISASGPAVGPNLIGGLNSGEGNTIAFNQGSGVAVNAAFGQSILGNSIFENMDLGIDLLSGGNNDQAPPVLISANASDCMLAFSAADYSIEESAGIATISVVRLCGTQGDVTVDFATADGTAVAGTDYTPASGTLNWADGDAADKTFGVGILSDGSLEGNETVELNLTNPGGSAGLGDPSQAILTILDGGGGGGNLSGGGCRIASIETRRGGFIPYVLILTLIMIRWFHRSDLKTRM